MLGGNLALFACAVQGTRPAASPLQRFGYVPADTASAALAKPASAQLLRVLPFCPALRGWATSAADIHRATLDTLVPRPLWLGWCRQHGHSLRSWSR